MKYKIKFFFIYLKKFVISILSIFLEKLLDKKTVERVLRIISYIQFVFLTTRKNDHIYLLSNSRSLALFVKLFENVS